MIMNMVIEIEGPKFFLAQDHFLAEIVLSDASMKEMNDASGNHDEGSKSFGEK